MEVGRSRASSVLAWAVTVSNNPGGIRVASGVHAENRRETQNTHRIRILVFKVFSGKCRMMFLELF